MLAEVGLLKRGNVLQMSFDFAEPQVAAESKAERLGWEKQILGMPVGVNPLDLVRDRLPVTTPLADLVQSPGKPVTIAGYRLPGWTGGPGFFLGDGTAFVIVKTSERGRGGEKTKAPPPWVPLVLQGRWVGEAYGTCWFEASGISAMETPIHETH